MDATSVPALTFTYTNWRGETGQRRVIPETFRFAATEWHPEPQWLLVAFDLDQGARRDFAFKDIVLVAFSSPEQQAATHILAALVDLVDYCKGICDPDVFPEEARRIAAGETAIEEARRVGIGRELEALGL